MQNLRLPMSARVRVHVRYQWYVIPTSFPPSTCYALDTNDYNPEDGIGDPNPKDLEN